MNIQKIHLWIDFIQELVETSRPIPDEHIAITNMLGRTHAVAKATLTAIPFVSKELDAKIVVASELLAISIDNKQNSAITNHLVDLVTLINDITTCHLTLEETLKTASSVLEYRYVDSKNINYRNHYGLEEDDEMSFFNVIQAHEKVKQLVTHTNCDVDFHAVNLANMLRTVISKHHGSSVESIIFSTDDWAFCIGACIEQANRKNCKHLIACLTSGLDMILKLSSVESTQTESQTTDDFAKYDAYCAKMDNKLS